MNEKNPYWLKNLHSLLIRHGYDLDREETVLDIAARTGVSRNEVSLLLAGDPKVTVETFCRLAQVLNVPAGELLNINSNLIRIYGIDGGDPVSIALPPLLAKIRGQLVGKSLFYASGLDDSYALLAQGSTVICSRGVMVPEVDALYLVETGSSRFVRRCIFVNQASNEAQVTDDFGQEKRTLSLNFGKIRLADSSTPMVIGRVLFSINQH